MTEGSSVNLNRTASGQVNSDPDFVSKIRSKLNRKCIILSSLTAFVVLVILIVCLVAVPSSENGNVKREARPFELSPFLTSNSPLGKFKKAAVSSDGHTCSSIVRDVLLKNGSAVDGAVAGLFCLGVVNPHSMGLGGGFLMTIYDRKSRQASVLDAREAAPLAAHKDMFHEDPQKSAVGGLSIGVPGEVIGYWEAHKKYGKLPWRTLVEPSIKLCEEGVRVHPHMKKGLEIMEHHLNESFSLKKLLTNPKTNELIKVNDTLKRPKLADTLRIIADEGASALYGGILGKMLVDDIQEAGGIITIEDLKAYKPNWKTPVAIEFKNGMKFYSSPPPGSGYLAGLVLKIMDKFNFTVHTDQDQQEVLRFYQRFAEAFKFAFAKRSHLGDEQDIIDKLEKEFLSDAAVQEVLDKLQDSATHNDISYYGGEFEFKEDHGTGHLSVVAPDGSAVSVTSTINVYFGSLVYSSQTGIILNNEMDDFSSPNIVNYFGLPPSKANFIKPGKRPMSSMTPSIFVDAAGDVSLVVGAAGGTKIVTSVTLVSLRNLWLGHDIKTAIDEPRVHHQLQPMELMYEQNFNQDLVGKLGSIGHKMTQFPVGGSVVCGIQRKDKMLYANSDFRKNGAVEGFD